MRKTANEFGKVCVTGNLTVGDWTGVLVITSAAACVDGSTRTGQSTASYIRAIGKLRLTKGGTTVKSDFELATQHTRLILKDPTIWGHIGTNAERGQFAKELGKGIRNAVMSVLKDVMAKAFLEQDQA